MRRRHVEVTLFIPVYVVLLLEVLVFFAWLGLVHKGFTLNEEAKLLAIIVGLVVFLASVVMTFLQSRAHGRSQSQKRKRTTRMTGKPGRGREQIAG